jgi:GT2 family glycosyltransferase
VAVRVLDLDAPLDDLNLSYAQNYRSVLALVRLAEDPIGVATFPVDPGGLVTRKQLSRGLHRQLGSELDAAYAQREREQRPESATDGFETSADVDGGPAPSVSVVVPTCSNPARLQRCLRSILACDYDDFEVIVVENRPGSLDTARMLVDSFSDAPTVRYVEEPRPGASHARNTGLAHAEGEIVAFADDDVVVDPQWLRANVDALRGAPEAVCVTGLILPLKLESDSQLLLEQFAGFSKGFQRKVYRLPESLEDNPLLPYAAGSLGSGASIVMFTDVARRLGGFDPALRTGGEDLDLLVRVLQRGQGVVYEPRAIVWHEHPTGMSRLRRQVYNYGVGLGAMLSKQLVAGPHRRRLLAAVPRGIRYLRDSKSRKNATKPTNYPRYLTWIERFGMLVGPLAYVWSTFLVHVTQLARHEAPTGRPLRIMRRMMVGGEAISVVWFREAEAPRDRFAWRRSRPVDDRGPSRRAIIGAAAVCAAAPLLVAAGAPTVLRAPAVLALLCLAPGIAWLAMVRGRAEPGLVIGISLAVAAVLAQSMLWTGLWRPEPFLYGLAAVCALPLSYRLLAILGSTRGGVAASIRYLRAARQRLTIPRRVAPHAALISVAMLAWISSLAGADLNRIGGTGLLAALPPTYFLSLALLIGGFVAAVASDEVHPRLLAAYVVGAVLVIHGTTPILYDEPRYAWVYKHLGVINLIAATGHSNRQIDIYTNWPSFFALNAWFSKTSGLTPIAYAGWAQLFFNIFNICAIRFALRALTRDERVLWTATLLFVLGNWVGQDYLAPQAFGFALSMVVLGLCLRCGQRVADPRFRRHRWPASSAWRKLGSVLPRPDRQESAEPAPVGPWVALASGAVCFLAVVTSHQLSPVMLIVSVIALAVVARKVPLWVPALMAAVEVWWVLLSLPFVQSHFQLIDPGGGGAAAQGRNLSAALPGAKLSLYAPGAVMAVVASLGLVGLIRRLSRGRLDVVPACLVAAPLAVVAFQSYGGEGSYRAYLFALPWLAFLAVFALKSPRMSPRWDGPSIARLTAAAAVIGACLLFAYFGQELANHVTSDDVRAATWYETRAPAGSMRIDLAPNAPDRLTARYPLVSLSDPPSLVAEAGFTGHMLGSSDVQRLIGLIRSQRARPAYVVLSRQQEGYALLNGLLPRGSLSSFVNALARSPAFRLVYHRPTVWIFEYPAPSSSGSAHG